MISRAWLGLALPAGALVCALGCASDTPSASAPAAGASGCVVGTPGCLPATAGGSTAPHEGGHGGVAAPSAGTGTAPTAGTGADPGAVGVPCEVAQIVSTHCTGCHQSPTKIGAPMPLMTLADFHASAPSDASKKVFEVIPGRLDPADPTKRMPQPPLAALSDAQKQMFNGWVNAGATGAADSCAITVTELTPGGTGGMPGTIMPGMGGAHIEPIEYDDPDMVCYKFQTHARGDKMAPYSHGPGESYINFDFAAPWEGTVYQRAVKVANDPNSSIIHHWLLFKQSGRVTDGAISTSLGTHPDGTLVYAWGPGASPMYFDPDVGVTLEGDVGYRLEAHFNGAGDDQSGAELCVTPHEPEHIAEIVWIGTDSIAGTSATGRCRPRGPFPIRAVAAQPHMHKLGSHMKATIMRAGGGEDVVHDLDFSFDSQQYYVKDFVMNEGDSLVTTCSYSGFATFGTSTSSEMCYFFVVAWPAGALRSGASLIHGPNSCL